MFYQTVYKASTDMLSMRLTGNVVHLFSDTLELLPGIYADYDSNRKIIAIDIHEASHRIVNGAKSIAWNFFYKSDELVFFFEDTNDFRFPDRHTLTQTNDDNIQIKMTGCLESLELDNIHQISCISISKASERVTDA